MTQPVPNWSLVGRESTPKSLCSTFWFSAELNGKAESKGAGSPLIQSVSVGLLRSRLSKSGEWICGGGGRVWMDKIQHSYLLGCLAEMSQTVMLAVRVGAGVESEGIHSITMTKSSLGWATCGNVCAGSSVSITSERCRNNGNCQDCGISWLLNTVKAFRAWRECHNWRHPLFLELEGALCPTPGLRPKWESCCITEKAASTSPAVSYP